MSGSLPVRPTVMDVFVVVVRVEGKVDGIVVTVGDHEQRLRRLESARWPLRSIAALAGVAAVIAPFVALR